MFIYVHFGCELEMRSCFCVPLSEIITSKMNCNCDKSGTLSKQTTTENLTGTATVTDGVGRSVN